MPAAARAELYQVLDPDFDMLGGELTLAQIREPLPEGDQDPAPFFTRHKTAERNKLRYQHDNLRRRQKRLQNAQTQVLANARTKLEHLSLRFLAAQFRDWPRFNFYGNACCNRCIPWNGHHTPNYWATNQPDCW